MESVATPVGTIVALGSKTGRASGDADISEAANTNFYSTLLYCFTQIFSRLFFSWAISMMVFSTFAVVQDLPQNLWILSFAFVLIVTGMTLIHYDILGDEWSRIETV